MGSQPVSSQLGGAGKASKQSSQQNALTLPVGRFNCGARAKTGSGRETTEARVKAVSQKKRGFEGYFRLFLYALA